MTLANLQYEAAQSTVVHLDRPTELGMSVDEIYVHYEHFDLSTIFESLMSRPEG